MENQQLYKGKHTQGEIEILKPNIVYENRFATFYDDSVIFPGGCKGSYIRMSYKNPFSVAVLPLLPDGKVMLIRIFRHGVRGWGLEVPKGFGNEGESFLQAAQRELHEETGLLSDDWMDIGEYYDCPSLNGSPLHCFIARNCRADGEMHLDEEEPDIQNRIISPESYNLSDGYDYTDNLTELFLFKYIGE